MASPTFHTAELSSCKLSYIDSFATRAVAERKVAYTTVIGLHGIGFNSAAWTPLLAALPPTIRFIAFNQRSYKGSSPGVVIKAPGGVDAMEVYLMDLLEFIAFVSKDLGVPKVPVAGGPGGITVLGWSKGCVLAISLLALLAPSAFPLPFSPSAPPTSLRAPLESHLRSVLLFEAPGSVLSRPFTPNFLAAMGHAFRPDTSTDVFAAASQVWLEAYSPGEPDASLLPPSGTHALSGQWGSDTWEPHCLQPGMAWKFSGDAAEVRAVTEKALAKVVPGESGDRLETIPVGVICGARTGDYFEDARKTIVEELWVKGGEGRTRRTAQRLVGDTNHFAFIHEPEKFAEALESIIEELGA